MLGTPKKMLKWANFFAIYISVDRWVRAEYKYTKVQNDDQERVK